MANLFSSLKLLLITAGAVSIFTAVRFSVPLVTAFCLYEVPLILSSVMAWMKPPYLYFIANVIIIVIATVSRFSCHQIPASQPPRLVSFRTPPPSELVVEEYTPPQLKDDAPPELVVEEAEVVEVRAVVVNGVEQLELPGVDHGGRHIEDGGDDVDKWIVPKSEYSAPQEIGSPVSGQPEVDFVPPVEEKQVALSRFSHVSKPPKARLPEGGRAVKVVGRRRRRQPVEEGPQHDSLENTWKMITEGRHVPITWDDHGGAEVVMDTPEPPTATFFRDRTNFRDAGLTVDPAPAPDRVKKEPSLSQDELNRRAEAFIKKFTEEMRLQREESLKKLNEMIHRGAY